MTTTRLTRRTLLKATGTAGVTWLATGCAAYSMAGKGPAFTPWNFPGDEARPEFLAVRAAILAANPHNTQPWLFRVTPDAIDLFADDSRHLGPMDSLRRELFIALGCALENLVLSARAHGRQAVVTYQPSPADELHAAHVALQPADPAASELYRAIPERRMNKFAYANELAVPTTTLDGLSALVDDPRTRLLIITDPSQRARLRQQNIDAIVAITGDEAMATASHLWWRQTPTEVEQTRDGLNLDILGLDAFTRSLAGSQATVSVAEANTYWVSATRGRHTTGAAWVVIATRDRNSRVEQVLAGRLFQRAHLYLTSRGVDAHTLNMIPELQDREETLNAAQRPFTAVCAEWVPAGFGLQLLTRIGYGVERAFHTPRRPIEAVLR